MIYDLLLALIFSLCRACELFDKLTLKYFASSSLTIFSNVQTGLLHEWLPQNPPALSGSSALFVKFAQQKGKSHLVLFRGVHDRFR